MFHVDAMILTLAFSKSVLVAVSWVFTFCALRTLPISIATPHGACARSLQLALADSFCRDSACMRRFSVALMFVLGARMFLETNLRRKGFALAMIPVGITLLCVV